MALGGKELERYTRATPYSRASQTMVKDCSVYLISNSTHERMVHRTVWYTQVSLATV